MKILKRILIVLVVLFALGAIVGLFLPKEVHVERSMAMNASPEKIYHYVDNLKKYNEYSPWHMKDTTTVYTYEGPESGVGAKMTWDGKHWQVGKGWMRTVETVPNSMIKRELYFMEDESKPAYGTFLFAPEGEGTKVTWALDADMGANPYKRLMGLMMGMVTKEFDAGLTAMKTRVENMPDEQASNVKIEETTVPAMHYLAVRDTASIPTIGQKLGMHFGSIAESIKKQGLNFAGPAFAIYYTDSQTNWELDACMPVDKAGKVDGKVTPGELAAGNAVVAHHFGDYADMGAAWNSLDVYLKANNKKVRGAPWEVYVTDPMSEKDTAKWQTDIYYPVD